MTDRVYLAGPIDHADDPFGWREITTDALLTAGVGEVVNPLEENEVWPEDGAELIRWDLKQVERCDVLVGRLGSVPTTGTHYEIERALSSGNRVVCHVADHDAVSRFVLDRPEIEFADSMAQAIGMMVDGGGGDD